MARTTRPTVTDRTIRGLPAGLAAVLVLATLTLPAVGSPADAQTAVGTLDHQPGVLACTSEQGSGGACVDGDNLMGARDTVVSPDGTSVYVVGTADALPGGPADDVHDGLAIFQRDDATGRLAQVAAPDGCISPNSTAGLCTDGRGVNGAHRVAISPDGRSVYTASVTDDAVAVFARDTDTGALTQLAGTDGCVSDSGAGGCTAFPVLVDPSDVTVSPDGAQVYVAAQLSGSVVVFDRDPITGALTQQSCHSVGGSGGRCTVTPLLSQPTAVVVASGGDHVYVTAAGSNAAAGEGALIGFDRDGGTGALTLLDDACVTETATPDCGDGVGLKAPRDLAISPDGSSLYTVSRNDAGWMAIIDRDPQTGALTQSSGACVSGDGSAGCLTGTGVGGASSIAVAPDGLGVYVAANQPAGAGVFGGAVAAFVRHISSGLLTQPSGEDACIAHDDSACAEGTALHGSMGVVVSPDGVHVYTASALSGSVTTFRRDAASAVITEAPTAGDCISDGGGICAQGREMEGTAGVTVSPDGRHAYAAAFRSPSAVLAFARTGDGHLTQLAGIDGCTSDGGSAGTCTDGQALGGAVAIVLSPDGRSAYVAAEEDEAIAVFSRDSGTGVLTQLPGTDGCVSRLAACGDSDMLDGVVSLAMAPDGTTLYALSTVHDGIIAFSRDTSTGVITELSGSGACVTRSGSGGCTVGRGLDGAVSAAVAPDGRHVYVAGSADDAVVTLVRDPGTGTLSQSTGTDGCVSEDGSNGCADGVALDAVADVAVSADGAHVYVAAIGSNALAVFDRDEATGALTQKAGPQGCISARGGACQTGIALDGLRAVAVPPDGASVHAAAEVDGAVVSFDRNPSTGVVSQKPGTAGCTSHDGTGGACRIGTGLESVSQVTVSPDNRSVYATSPSAQAGSGISFGGALTMFTRASLPDPSVPPPAGGGGEVPVDSSVSVVLTEVDGDVVITVANDGQDPVDGGTLVIELDGGPLAGVPEGCEADGDTLTCTIGEIAAGQRIVITLTAAGLTPLTVTLPAALDGDLDAAEEQVGTATPQDLEDAIDAAIRVSRERFDAASGFAQVRPVAGAVVLSRVDVFADGLTGSALTGDAPMLFTPAEGLDDQTAAEIDRVLGGSGTVYLLGGTAALSADVAADLEAAGYTTRRLEGATRFETAQAIAEEVVRRNGTPTSVALARAFGPQDSPTAAWADAVTGGGWAADSGQPILLTETSTPHATVTDFLADHPAEVVILGGTSAISAAVETQLQADRRIAGDNRFATATAIADDLWTAEPTGYLVTPAGSADGWAYAMAAAGYAADSDQPILLAEPDRLPAETDQQTCASGVRDPVLVIAAISDIGAAVRDALAGPCP